MYVHCKFLNDISTNEVEYEFYTSQLQDPVIIFYIYFRYAYMCV